MHPKRSGEGKREAARSSQMGRGGELGRIGMGERSRGHLSSGAWRCARSWEEFEGELGSWGGYGVGRLGGGEGLGELLAGE